MSKERRILGIDPGTSITGYGIIRSADAQFELKDYGIIDLRKISDTNEKLRKIFHSVCRLIDDYKINEFAAEAPFFGKNVQSMLKLGKSQGVAIAAALSKGLDIHEHSPRKIKMSVTGNGNASKKQVAVFLENTFKQSIQNLTLDATDGIAAAVCQAYGNNAYSRNRKKTDSWKSFINKNPNRIMK